MKKRYEGEGVVWDRIEYWLCYMGLGIMYFVFTVLTVESAPALAGALFMLYVIGSVLITIPRCRDIGLPWQYSFLILIPYASFYFIFRRGFRYYDEEAARIKEAEG